MKILGLSSKKISTAANVAVKRVLTLVVLFTIALSANASPVDLGAGIVPSIEVMKANYASGDKLEVRVNYKNISSEKIRFLKLGTALEGIISEDFLSISLDGNSVPYVGLHIKRLAPTELDFVTIEPGQKVSAVIDLASSYAISAKGAYQLLYKGGSVPSAEQSLKAVGGAILNLSEDRTILLFRRTPIIDRSCSTVQRDQINQALAIAERIGIQASQDLNDAPVDQRPSAQRYREWFGVFEASRYESVRRGMANIASALVNQRIGFDCTCDIPGRDRVFAFVRANDPFNMNVCPVFFRVSPSGTDSRSGTIIHEISHFTIVAASDDFSSALDQAGSRALANSSPANAIRNANAFEYFAENTPFLSMPGPVPATPDLIVESGLVSAVTAAANQSLSISGVIANQGGEVSASTFLRLELIDDSGVSSITQVAISAVSSGEGINFQIDFQAPVQAGEYQVEICITPVVGESNTDNNCRILAPLNVERGSLIISPILPLLLDD